MSANKVKTILVSQPEPNSENSPYTRLKEKHNLTIDFRPFIHVEGVEAKEVRQQKIDFNDFDSIILTSRNSVDHFSAWPKKCALKCLIALNTFASRKQLLTTSKNMLFTANVRFM